MDNSSFFVTQIQLRSIPNLLKQKLVNWTTTPLKFKYVQTKNNGVHATEIQYKQSATETKKRFNFSYYFQMIVTQTTIDQSAE